MAVKQVNVIVMPFVGTTAGKHVAVLMMIEIDTIKDRLPIAEVLFSVDEDLNGFTALLLTDDALEQEECVERAPPTDTAREHDGLNAEDQSLVDTHVIEDERIIRMPNVEHLLGVLEAKTGGHLARFETKIGTTALLSLEKLVLRFEVRDTIHVHGREVGIVGIIGISELFVTEFVVPRGVHGLGVDDTAICGFVTLTRLPDGGASRPQPAHEAPRMDMRMCQRMRAPMCTQP